MNPGPDLCIYFFKDWYTSPNLGMDTYVKNIGTAPSGICYQGYYLSTDQTVGSDIFLGQDLVHPLLRGADQHLRRTFDLSSYPGTWYLLRILDCTGVVDEDNELNNYAISQPTPIQVGPNLTFKPTFDPPFYLYHVYTQQLDINVIVENNGSVSAGSSVLGFYLSADTDISTSDVKLGDVPVFSLAPGSMTTKSFTVGNVLNFVPSGNWVL